MFKRVGEWIRKKTVNFISCIVESALDLKLEPLYKLYSMRLVEEKEDSEETGFSKELVHAAILVVRNAPVNVLGIVELRNGVELTLNTRAFYSDEDSINPGRWILAYENGEAVSFDFEEVETISIRNGSDLKLIYDHGRGLV